MAHAAPPVPLPLPDQHRPPPPPIDRPSGGYPRTYLVLALVLAGIVIAGALYVTYGIPPPPAKLVLVPKGTRVELAPSAHAYFGPTDLTAHATWTVSGEYLSYRGVPVSFGFLTAAAFASWQSSGFPNSYFPSSHTSNGEVPFQTTLQNFSYYVVWVDQSSTANTTISTSQAIVATSTS